MSAAVSSRWSRAGHLLRAVFLFTLAPVAHAADFEGTIEIVITQSGGTTSLRHTVGAESERIEIIGSDAPNPVDLVERKSGAITRPFSGQSQLPPTGARGRDWRAERLSS